MDNCARDHTGFRAESAPLLAAVLQGDRRPRHSLLSWSENLGELAFGATLALVAAVTSATVALIGSAGLLLVAGAIGTRGSVRSNSGGVEL